MLDEFLVNLDVLLEWEEDERELCENVPFVMAKIAIKEHIVNS